MNKEGVEQYNPLGEEFDPNQHSALFEVADPTKAPNTIAVVTKVCSLAGLVCLKIGCDNTRNQHVFGVMCCSRSVYHAVCQVVPCPCFIN